MTHRPLLYSNEDFEDFVQINTFTQSIDDQIDSANFKKHFGNDSE